MCNLKSKKSNIYIFGKSEPYDLIICIKYKNKKEYQAWPRGVYTALQPKIMVNLYEDCTAYTFSSYLDIIMTQTDELMMTTQPHYT